VGAVSRKDEKKRDDNIKTVHKKMGSEEVTWLQLLGCSGYLGSPSRSRWYKGYRACHWSQRSRVRTRLRARDF
jgi:hypothetical protein